MEFKDGIIILINLAILGTVIAAAVYIFQIGDKKRSVKCGAVDMFQQGIPGACPTADSPDSQKPLTPCSSAKYDPSGWGEWNCPGEDQDNSCTCSDTGKLGRLWKWGNNNPDNPSQDCVYDTSTGKVVNPRCGGGYCLND